MDLGLVKWLNGKVARCFPFDIMMDFICRFGHLAFIVYGIWLWFGGDEAERRKRREAALTALFSVAICSCLSFLIGKVWARPRPFTQDAAIWNFTAHKANASFPSNHTMNAAAVSMVLLRMGMPGAVFMTGLAVVLAFSRMYAGIHYLTDLIGAVLLAAGVHMAVCRLRFLQMTARAFAEISLYIDFWRQGKMSPETRLALRLLRGKRCM